jgi:hypothetical protein
MEWESPTRPYISEDGKVLPGAIDVNLVNRLPSVSDQRQVPGP